WLIYSPIYDPDFGWHLQNGLDIVQSRSIVTQDKYTLHQPFYYVYHSWARDVLIAQGYQQGGRALVALFPASILASTISYLVFRQIKQISLPKLLVAIMTIIFLSLLARYHFSN